MTQRDIFYKWLFYTLLGLFWVVLQQMLLNHLDFWGGVHPFVLPLIGVMVAILEKRHESAFFSICCGLFCDLLMPGIIPCFYTLAFLCEALLSSFVAGRIIMPGFLCAAVCSVLAVVLTNLLQILFVFPTGNFALADALALTGRELLLTLPFSPFIFLTFRKIRKLLRNE